MQSYRYTGFENHVWQTKEITWDCHGRTEKNLREYHKISRVCVRLLDEYISTKKSHTIHSTKEFIKIYQIFNTKRHFISC